MWIVAFINDYEGGNYVNDCIKLNAVHLCNNGFMTKGSWHLHSFERRISFEILEILEVSWAANQHIMMISEGSCDWRLG